MIVAFWIDRETRKATFTYNRFIYHWLDFVIFLFFVLPVNVKNSMALVYTTMHEKWGRTTKEFESFWIFPCIRIGEYRTCILYLFLICISVETTPDSRLLSLSAINVSLFIVWTLEIDGYGGEVDVESRYIWHQG